MKRKIKKSFLGSIEDFDQLKNNKTIDLASLNWTLCNCSNPISVLQSINNSLVDSGFLMITESSRILVPFKKPIYNYFNSITKLYSRNNAAQDKDDIKVMQNKGHSV